MTKILIKNQKISMEIEGI